MKIEYKILGLPLKCTHNSAESCLQIGRFPIYKKTAVNSNTVAPSKHPRKVNSSSIRIAIQLKGGIGDQLIGCNYVKALWDKIHSTDVQISVYCRPFIGELFLTNADFISGYFSEASFNTKDDNYDVYIRLDRFPDVLKYDDRKIQKNSILYKYVLICQNFKAQNNVFYSGRSEYDSVLNIYSLIRGQKRINQMDIEGFLGIDEGFKYVPSLPESKIILDYNLKEFITLHRGVDSNRTANSIKMWPLKSYNRLIKLIKQRYPQYKIVQLGINEQRCPTMEDVDLNLVGKTSLEDIACLLKHSVLHIDCEGGMVHIRHAIGGGKSIVFFGPTSKDFYGYPENINMSSNVCSHWCEHIKGKWDEGCLKTGGYALCMGNISPRDVFEEVKGIL